MKRNVISFFSLLLLSAFFFHNLQAQDADIVGQNAPDFNLKNIDGNMVALGDYEEEKGVIVIFTCNHCPYSKLYEDRIVALDKKFKDRGFPVVAINPNDPNAYPSDDFKHMKKRAKEKGFTFPYLVDDSQEIAKAYGATRTPHVFLLESVAGEFLVRYIGAIDDNAREEDEVEEVFLEDAIESLESGKKPTTTTTKAIGCTIKWKKS